MCNLDKIITSYDIVLCSPTLETGISLDIKALYQCLGAIQVLTNSVRQALAFAETLLYRAMFGLFMVLVVLVTVKHLYKH